MRARSDAGKKVRATGVLLLAALFSLSILFFPHRSRGQSKPANAGSSDVTAPSGSAAVALPGGSEAASSDPEASSDRPAPPTKGPAADETKDLTIPTGKGLPVLVHPAFFFLELKSFDDTQGVFEGVVDMRLRWSDTRLRYAPADAPRGYKEYRGAAAEEFLKTIWTPLVEVTNRIEIAPYVGRRVRIFPDGDVESMERTTGKYRVPVDAKRFPFDRQFLRLDVIVRDQTSDEVLLEFLRDDVVFSRTARNIALEGWTPGLVNLQRGLVPGWNGDRYSRAAASLFIDRVPTEGITPIFIPLIASLLIPLLALWMNKPNEDGFEVDAFELANISIGGLFSVIALSFAIYTSYGVIAGSDNTVTRLFGLNYMTLAISLAVVIMFYRFNWPRRLFGPYVQEELFHFLTWAMPVLVVGTSIALLLVAAA